jgi:hypothetical protein
MTADEEGLDEAPFGPARPAGPLALGGSLNDMMCQIIASPMAVPFQML